MSNSFKYKMYYTRTHRKEKPKTLHDDQYGALLEYWQTEGFEEISERALQNRASDCGGRGEIVHYGGAKPRSAHEKEMRDKLGREPKVDEVFLKMYTRKDEEGNIEWASPATEAAYNRFLKNIAPLTINEEGEEPIVPPPDVQMQVWAQTQGVSKKGDVLGLSGRANIVRPLRIGRTQDNYVDPQLLQQIIERVESQIATIREEMRAEMRAEMQTMREEMRAEMQTMREEMRVEMQTMREEMRVEMQTMQSRHQAELDQYRMMLNLAMQNRTCQPSQHGQRTLPPSGWPVSTCTVCQHV